MATRRRARNKTSETRARDKPLVELRDNLLLALGKVVFRFYVPHSPYNTVQGEGREGGKSGRRREYKSAYEHTGELFLTRFPLPFLPHLAPIVIVARPNPLSALGTEKAALAFVLRLCSD